jgi:hypothetical protein
LEHALGLFEDFVLIRVSYFLIVTEALFAIFAGKARAGFLEPVPTD